MFGGARCLFAWTKYSTPVHLCGVQEVITCAGSPGSEPLLRHWLRFTGQCKGAQVLALSCQREAWE